VAEEKNVELAPGKSGINVKTLIIIAVVVVILMAASIGVTVFLFSGNSEESKSDDSDDSSSDESEQVELASKPAIYFLLKPDFVINFESEGKANFLSVQVQLMARDNGPIRVIEAHMPVLKNNIILLLSAQKYHDVRKIEGKEKLRKDMLGIMKDIIDNENKQLKKQDGEDYQKVNYIENIFFTGFIMQ